MLRGWSGSYGRHCEAAGQCCDAGPLPRQWCDNMLRMLVVCFDSHGEAATASRLLRGCCLDMLQRPRRCYLAFRGGFRLLRGCSDDMLRQSRRCYEACCDSRDIGTMTCFEHMCCALMAVTMSRRHASTAAAMLQGMAVTTAMTRLR